MGGRGVSRIPGWLWDWTCSRWRAGICPSVSRSQGQLRLGVTSMSVRAGGFSSCEPQSLSRLTLTLLRDTLCPASLRGPPPAQGGTCLSFRDRACAVLAVLLLDPPWPRGLSSDPMVLQDLEDPLSGPTAPPPLRVGTRMPPPSGLSTAGPVRGPGPYGCHAKPVSPGSSGRTPVPPPGKRKGLYFVWKKLIIIDKCS